MTARGMLLLMTLGAALLGALLVGTIILAIGAGERTRRIDGLQDRVTTLRERVVRDEAAFCRVLALTPDHEQSRQIGDLARVYELGGRDFSKTVGT
jgi:hypothetical protein